MNRTYFLLAALFLGVVLIVVYAVQSKRTFDDSVIIDTNVRMESALSITSSAFENGGRIPPKFTCDGDRGLSPQLSISGVPAEAKSLALIMDDPDVPKALKPDGVFDHWTLLNLPADRQAFRIEEGEVPEGAVVGVNGAGKSAYTGPCPPSQYEPSEHRYIFALYALDTKLALPEGATKREVLSAMDGHIIAEARLVGLYKRQ